ncbi:MAG: hypothetical protein V4612_03740 [Pseudomonadota bacterium]
MTNENIEVIIVKTRKQERQFISFPFDLYKGDSCWVSLPKSELMKSISRTKNPFFKEAIIEHFIVILEKEITGRVSVTIHQEYNIKYNTKTAFFGHFECINDYRVVKAMMDRAILWAKDQDAVTNIKGPYSYCSTQEVGFLTTNFNEQPKFLQPYTKKYYPDLCKKYGFKESFTASTYNVKSSYYNKSYTDFLEKYSQKLKKKHNFYVRSMDKKKIKSEIEIIRNLFNKSFYDNHEIVGISRESFEFQISPLLKLVNPNFIRIIEKDNIACAFVVMVPDLNEFFCYFKGLKRMMLPFFYKKFINNINSSVIALIGTEPSLQGSGLGRMLGNEIVKIARNLRETSTMWIDDRNPNSWVLAKNSGMAKERTYVVLEKKI